MGRNNSPIRDKELRESIENYEAAKAEGHKLYMDASQLADMADWYATELRFEEAKEVINYGLQLHPNNSELQVQHAYLFLDINKVDEANRVANQISDQNDRDVKLLKAEIFLNKNRLADAQEILYSIEDKDQLETISHIVTLYLDMGFEQIAKEWLDRAERLYADKEEFISLKADYMIAINDLEESIVCFNQLIDLSPFNPSYWGGLAKCYLIEGNTEKCVEACDFALAADEEFGEAYAYKGHCYFYIANNDLCIENYQKAIEMKAIPAQIGNMFIGMSLCNKAQWKEALECLDKVIDLFEKQGDRYSYMLTETYSSKIHALCGLKREEEAMELCRNLIKEYPNDATFHILEGQIYLTMKQEEKAHQSFMQATEIDPSVQTWYTIGGIYSDYRLLNDAKMAYLNAYAINPKYSDLPERLCIISIMTNDLENFFKFNQECDLPFNENTIKQLIEGYEHKEEIQPILNEILEYMMNERNKNLN